MGGTRCPRLGSQKGRQSKPAEIPVPNTGHRRPKLPAAFLLAALAVACGSRVEQTVLRGYFDTCAAADDVALANAALVTLDPKRDGVVGAFRVVKVDPPVQQPAAVHPQAVHLSLLDPVRPRNEDGAVLITENVQLRAEVHREGRMSTRPMVVTLARAKTADEVGRWIVVRLVLDGRTLPEASSGPR